MAGEATTTSSDDVIATLAKIESTERRIQILEEIPPERELLPGVTISALLRHLRLELAPAPAPAGCQLTPDLVYGTAGVGGRELTLHLYTRDSGGARPGVIFVHGGGWANGHPNSMSAVASTVAGDGCVTATISYRLSGEARWPAAVEDAKCAVRWMRAHADEIGVDPARIAIAGESAGGHLAAMVATTPGRWEGTGGWGDEYSEVQLAVLYCPAVDLKKGLGSQGHEAVRQFLGDTERAVEASPITHVTSRCPPVLTQVGAEDTLTTPDSAREFHRVLDAAGVRNRLDILPGRGHGLIFEPDACAAAVTSLLASDTTEPAWL